MKRKLTSILMVLVLLIGSLVFASCDKKVANENQSANSIKTITTEEVEKNISSDNWVVVDTRENDAFNGWALDGVKRGGHIKGATDFSAAWLKVENKDKEKILDEALETKKITKDKNIVLYDANGKDAKEVADYLANKGYKNIYTYDVKQWASDDSKEMESYENYEMIVSAPWVKDLIDGKNPEGYQGKGYKIFEVSWGEEKDSPDYLSKGHIKGAIHVNTDDIEEGPLWNRKSDEELIEFAKNNGITVDTTVIAYGSDQAAASRLAVILKYLGVKDVRLLNGGTDKWVSYGYELEKTSNPKVAVESFGADKPLNKDYIVDLDEAKKIIADKEGSRLVDIRSWDEMIGKTSGYDYIKPKGRPAGSVWGHGGSDSSHLEDFRNIDNTMRNKDEILAMWKEYDITPDKNLSFFCGTGWRAAEVLLYADTIGIEKISLYDGGWNEWSGNTGNTPNPIETGEPQKK